MKKVVLILVAILAVQSATVVRASEPTFNVLLAGGAEQSQIRIWLTPDGRTYVIDSIVPLEVGGTICENASGNAAELLCQARMIASFEVNAGSGNDTIIVSKDVPIPVTLRGGPGQDLLIGGSGPDKLIGGDGGDRLFGRNGDDLIIGGEGNDTLSGGPGKDVLRGGYGVDTLGGGSGSDNIRQDKIEL